MRKPLLLLLPAALLVGYTAALAPAANAQASNTERAKKIYQVDCALCHGDSGDGKTDLGKDMGVVSNFNDAKTFEGKSDQQLFDLIRKGKDKMPGEEEARAKDAEVKALIQYIRNLSKNAPAAAPAPAPAPAAEPAPAPAPAPTAPSGR